MQNQTQSPRLAATRPNRARLDDLLARRARHHHRQRIYRATQVEDMREALSLIGRRAS